MDRQDIDALLVGALYGELTPADEARLAVHLESHPTDRGALDDLKTARQAVRESRIFDIQLDPPQAVSALLLQEAHRRAPKRVVHEGEKEGWFARFTRTFFAHPAMAAAAMLVVVVGVAGTLYVRKGDQFAQKEVATAPTSAAGSAALTDETKPTAAADPSANALDAATGGESSYNVDLAEKDISGKDGEGKADKAKLDRAPAAERKREESPKVAEKPQPQQKKAVRGINVQTKQPQPKELAKSSESQLAFDDEAAPAKTAAPKGAATGAGGTAAHAESPAGIAAPSRTTAQAPPPAAAPASPPVDPSLIAWAKQTLEQAASLAQEGGKCDRAAQLVQQIAEKAPTFYSSTVATDRRLKGCQSYIVKLREQQSEEKNKARAQKRVNADEYAPAPAK